jgi:hypothetical protein
MDEPVIYISYLLRLWQVPSDEKPTWRIVLENIQSGEISGFGDIKELATYLRQVLEIEQNTVNATVPRLADEMELDL